MTEIAKPESNDLLSQVINWAIQAPGVKTDRDSFLRSFYRDKPNDLIEQIVEKGPVEAGMSQSDLRNAAQRIIQENTLKSTGASFVAGLPGGLAMFATIPADMMQYYGVSLIMAQEIAYLYGEPDLWKKDYLEGDDVTKQLILYFGVMLGVSGAAQTVRVTASMLAQQALKKIPQQALTKKFYYQMVKAVAKALGVRMTKSTFAKGVSKAIPVIGGIISGGVTYLTMPPMGNRLVDTLEKARFSYDDADFATDWEVITEETMAEEQAEKQEEDHPDSVPSAETDQRVATQETANHATDGMFEKINQAKLLYEQGVLTEEEFFQMKMKIIQNS